MAVFRVFGKSESEAEMVQIVEVDQITAAVPVEPILTAIADRWLALNGRGGQLELRNAAGTVLMRLRMAPTV